MELKEGDEREIQGIVARANYLAMDSPDVQYATKGVQRDGQTDQRRPPKVEEVGKGPC